MAEREQLPSAPEGPLAGACPDCGESRVRRVGMFEHEACGFVDVAAVFETVGHRLCCPKCDERVEPGDEEFCCVGFLGHCAECDARFDVGWLVGSRGAGSVDTN